MKIFSLENFDYNYQKIIIIGNFDGIHKGHQELINFAKKIADEKKFKLGILTFEPHPISFFSKNLKNYRITNKNLKAEILENYSLDFLINAEFNQEFASISAEDFIEEILVKKLNSNIVVTGEDFIFGKNRVGNKNLLTDFSKKSGFEYFSISLKNDENNNKFSSRNIRTEIEKGNLQAVFKMLGRNYIISGEVIKGRGEGRKLGFPTANLDFDDFIIPKFGVYFCNLFIEGKSYKALTNIGVRPSFDLTKPLIEIHIPNFSEDIYGKKIKLELLEFVRNEIKFNSIDELKTQISEDVKNFYKKFNAN
ncbi:MAG: bifunctional riboflavin kinase/FAD synthetase [Rickettsiales bacterium]|nr:bifunctional riboflavin kinase/FAD synthetase [Rickettsiales bacterium]